MLPPETIVEHDFTRGPWWLARTFDVVWSVEFVEHVGPVHVGFQAGRAAVCHVECWYHVEVHEDGCWRI